MSQFGSGPKPPGWAQPGQARLPTSGVFPGQFGMGGSSTPSQFGLPNAMGMMPGLGGLVNQAAFQQNPVGMGMLQQAHNVQQQLHANAARVQALQQQAAAAAPAPQKNQRTFIGVVTKMHDNYGFVDDDVFFQHSVIRGNPPRVGDRVMVEATFNPSMPFKWNAHRVQLLTEGASAPPAAPIRQQPAPMPMQASGPPVGSRWGPSTGERVASSRVSSPPRRRASPPPARRASPPRRSSPPRRVASPVRRRSPSPRRASPRRVSPRRSPGRVRELKRERSSPASATPKASTPAAGAKKESSASPPRRRARIIPRYVCNTPKQLFFGSNLSHVSLKKRFNHLYIPSDFTEASIDWVNQIPLESPLDLSQAVHYHIFHKDVDLPESEIETFDTSDADSRHQVKVLLLAHPDRSTLQQKTWGLLADGSTDDSFEPVSLLKNLHLLVGSRGKELLGIGGAWSPSQDGEDPSSLSTLIKTAIRTTRTLTGIDLSNVAAWYQLVQVCYFRGDRGRLDRVTLLLADTAGIVPDSESLSLLEAALAEQLSAKLAGVEGEKEEPKKDEITKAEEKKIEEAEEDMKEESGEGNKKEETMDMEMTSPEKKKDESAMENEEGAASHWSKLDVKALKVAELKSELDARGLETKGIKTLLAQRLQDALEREKKDEEEKKKGGEGGEKEKKEETASAEKKEEKKTEAVEKTEAEKMKEEAERKKAVEKAEKERKEKRSALEKHYTFPKEPRVLVFPSKNAKGGKFDCKVVSLQNLLEYRHDDNKESQFEVALFAECLRDVVERSMTFRVYAAVAQAGEREAEKKKREEARKEREGSEGDKEEKKGGDKEEKKEEEKKIELRSVVVQRDIFEAFAYFDQNLCGYLLERDLEEIISSGELGIPRGQVTKLAKKLCYREKMNYRHLTDSLVDGEGETRYTPSAAEGSPSMHSLARGYGSRWQSDVEETEAVVAANAFLTDSSSGLVTIDGCIVNVRQKLTSLKKLETEREAGTAKLKEMETSLKNLKDTKDAIDKKRRRLDDDLEKYKKRLHESERNLKASQEEATSLKMAMAELKKLGERVAGLAEKSLPKKKKEEEKKEEKAGEDKKKTDKNENGTKEEEEETLVLDAEIVLADQVGEDDVKKEEEVVEGEKESKQDESRQSESLEEKSVQA